MTTSVQIVTSPSRFSWIVGGDRRVEMLRDGFLSIVQIDSKSFAIIDEERQTLFGICTSCKQAQKVLPRIMRDFASGWYTR